VPLEADLDGRTASVPDPISLLLTPNANYAQHTAACIAAVLGQTDGVDGPPAASMPSCGLSEPATGATHDEH
jgi:hypothetical protein